MTIFSPIMRVFQLNLIILVGANDLLITLPNGNVRGIHRDNYFAFEGIPYAKAPLDELRFEPPQPYTDKWNGVWDARKPGAACMQWDQYQSGANKLIGDEDCLFINVYTPSVNNSVGFPVLAHIHGGAFMFGTSHSKRCDHFLRRNFVFVTFNYRLGPLGFLSTESSVVPGNMGLKDQVMALKWVQHNIHAFGGDLNMVTLSGFSAGGASAHLHLMSDMSKGLFQRAIAHSGSALNPWVQAGKMLDKTKRIAIEVGCTSSSDEQNIIQCLKQKPASDIVSSVGKFLEFLYNPFSPFGVVVEGDRAGSFLVDTPIKLLNKKRVHNVPLIMSAAEMEGLYPTVEFYNELTINEINDKWNKFLPSILDYQDTVEPNLMSKKIRSHYLGSSPLTKETFHKFAKLVTDRLFLSGIGESARLHQLVAPVYFYYYTYKSSSKELRKECLGVGHGEDMLLYKKRKFPYTQDEEVMIESMLNMYESFSSTGRPVFGESKMLQVGEALTFNVITAPERMEVKSFINFGDVNFWTTLDLD